MTPSNKRLIATALCGIVREAGAPITIAGITERLPHANPPITLASAQLVALTWELADRGYLAREDLPGQRSIYRITELGCAPLPANLHIEAVLEGAIIGEREGLPADEPPAASKPRPAPQPGTLEHAARTRTGRQRAVLAQLADKRATRTQLGRALAVSDDLGLIDAALAQLLECQLVQRAGDGAQATWSVVSGFNADWLAHPIAPPPTAPRARPAAAAKPAPKKLVARLVDKPAAPATKPPSLPERIKALLADGPKDRHEIAKALGIEPQDVSVALTQLKTRGSVRPAPSGGRQLWALAAAGEGAPATTEESSAAQPAAESKPAEAPATVKESLTAQAGSAGVGTLTESEVERILDVHHAMNDLGDQAQRQRALRVTDLTLKTATLRRLALLMASEIGAVLRSAASDLEALA